MYADLPPVPVPAIHYRDPYYNINSTHTERTASMADAPSPLDHAVCITGLQRSYPEISHNIHYSLSHFYAGWPPRNQAVPPSVLSNGHAANVNATVDAVAAVRGGWRLERSVGFFGVRPANDSWAVVRTDLPPLQGESIQTPCGLGRPAWFSAYAKTAHQRVTYGFSFVQMMCDLAACHSLIRDYEARVGRQFQTIARLRLDLAWETPLEMPPQLLPNVVYTTRMNAKAGVNDKWAIGRRSAMAAYLDRVRLIPVANSLLNLSGKLISLRATASKDGMLVYECPQGSVNVAFACIPRRTRQTAWQNPDGAEGARVQNRRFTLTSEGFLQWALWRANVSIAFEPLWMFCKFGNAVNTTARICVPRMRKETLCQSLVCPGGLTDCGCRNSTCKNDRGTAMWYCEPVNGQLLRLDPYRKGLQSPTY